MVQQPAAVQSIRFSTAPSAAQTIQAFFEMLLLSIWFGAMVFFSFCVAPSAFSALPTKQLAALVVTSTLSKVELIGLVCGPLLIASILIRPPHGRKWKSSVTWPRVALLILMTASAALSRFTVTPVMVAIRSSLPDIIDRIPASDPSRMRFDNLHQYSVALMTGALLAGLLTLFLTVHAWMKR